MSDIVNGTVYVTDTRHDEHLVFVTIEGNDPDRPMIIAFDSDDLQSITTAHETLKQGPQPCTCTECAGAQRSNVRHITDARPDRQPPRALDFFNTEVREPDPGAVLEVLNAEKRNNRFIHDRVEYRYDTALMQWIAWGRTDIDDQDGAW
ncbi:hypothetical protein [Mycolicibacterium sp. HS_4_1]